MTQFSIQTIDLPSLVSHIHRQAVGFDSLFERLDRTFVNSKADGNYPPHNIIKVDETHYAIQVAVAGFAEDELDIEFKDNIIIVKGEKKQKDEQEYIHRGIGLRNFTRKGATVVNGILAISIEHVVPDEQKPKKIAITFTK
jgi:molecular chaperone IbpA